LFIPSARILERQKHHGPWIVGGLVLARAGYLLILVLPFLLHSLLPELTVAILVAMTVPSVFFSTAWSPMLSDVIPERSRATVLAWRSILSSATIAPLVYFFGRWLDRGVFPRNYQWMYGVGLLGGFFSAYLISRIKIPERNETTTPVRPQRGNRQWRQALRELTQANRGFVRIIINTLLFDLGAWTVGPLYIVFFVRELGASDSWVGLHSTLAHIGVVAGYWVWRWIIKRIGENKAMLIALPLVSTYAFMVALVPQLTFILFAGFLINVLAPGVNLSHGVIFLRLLPVERRPTWIALYSTVMNVGAFVCPLIGVAISKAIGIVPMLLIGGAMRMAGAMLFYLFPVVEEGAMRLPGALLRPRLFGRR
ncbi:MAG: MFS transporter, partial [Chloroflexi bacterium]|nr:MFS transporter [Chloroflexota bacterium]